MEEQCISLAGQIDHWLEEGSPIPSYIVALTFLGDAAEADDPHWDGHKPFAYVLRHVPNLIHLDLGGEPLSSSPLFTLLLTAPRLRSLSGVVIAKDSYEELGAVLCALGSSLERLLLVCTFGGDLVKLLDRGQKFPVVVNLPVLRQLTLYMPAFTVYERVVFEDRWSTPALTTVTLNMGGSPDMGTGSL
jgi:hypothetical protein